MNHQLPEAEKQLLHRLKTENLPGFRARVRDLREAGWTLQSVGDAMGNPRSTVLMWENTARQLGTPSPVDVDAVPTPPARPDPSVRTRSLPLDVPPADRERLRELTEQARTVRGWTPSDSPSRVAARELDELLEKLKNRGIPVTKLAVAAGVTRRAVAARLERVESKRTEPDRPDPVSDAYLEITDNDVTLVGSAA